MAILNRKFRRVFQAWLASPRLKAAVDAYLPNAYKQAKVVALRIGDGVKPLPEVRTPSTPAPDYWSGYWHHDRCGRRLKAFLFLRHERHSPRRDVWGAVSDRASRRVYGGS